MSAPDASMLKGMFEDVSARVVWLCVRRLLFYSPSLPGRFYILSHPLTRPLMQARTDPFTHPFMHEEIRRRL